MGGRGKTDGAHQQLPCTAEEEKGEGKNGCTSSRGCYGREESMWELTKMANQAGDKERLRAGVHHGGPALGGRAEGAGAAGQERAQRKIASQNRSSSLTSGGDGIARGIAREMDGDYVGRGFVIVFSFFTDTKHFTQAVGVALRETNGDGWRSGRRGPHLKE
jgi:hypothetical protein